MGVHSILPPSGSTAWRQCGLWVTMNHYYPKPDTPESLEGTAAHWVMEEVISGQPVAEGQISPNGTVVTQEMIEGGELVIETVQSRIGTDFTHLYVEERVHIPAIHEQCFGTLDLRFFDRTTMTLDLFDYKFGHRFVEEYENDQCIAYLSGVLEKLAVEFGRGVGEIDQAIKVNITIIQPRCYYKGSPVRTWSFVASDIRAHINRLNAAAARALMPNPTAATNSECIDCPGRHVCPALQKAGYSDAEFAVQSSPVQLTPEAASLELKMLERAGERLQSRIEGLTEQVKGYIKQGHRVPWQRVEQGYGRPAWNIPNAQVVSLGQLYGVDLSKPGLLTPKQAIKAGVDESVIKVHSYTPTGSIKLVPENPADIKRIFGTTF